MEYSCRCKVVLLAFGFALTGYLEQLNCFELSGVWALRREVSPSVHEREEFSWGNERIGLRGEFYIDLGREIPALEFRFYRRYSFVSMVEKLRNDLFKISYMLLGLESRELYINVIDENRIWLEGTSSQSFINYGREVVYHRIAGPGANFDVSLEGVTDDIHRRYSGLWVPVDEQNPTLQKWGGSWGVAIGSSNGVQIDLVRSIFNMFIDRAIVVAIDKVEQIDGNTVRVSGVPHDGDPWDKRYVWILHIEIDPRKSMRLWIETTDSSDGYMDGPWGSSRSSATLLKRVAGPGVKQ